ncbi:hypothetical protein H6G80_30160 [Nostoc sp. FACHB-87]|uniref:hypothetical protein n=1 Tax=Nostocales TaxID=1161 RepID=UPI0016878066|nr:MULTISPECIES: hypothetical protein [Nostocales]MBD2303817.1 hypothetical protein [Nostoc sp. FACHB-190]MBD2458319.1 hypothetical protein [Nostoc sp. FACHB-87]MBD2479467.1 hypothetical protein [Anabaena sp. FACHB-83]MBD2491238.1 hypothetical protein [Aulosira sp. FACHB-615]
MTLLEKKKMVKIWTFWEFEHSSKNIIRVIDAPQGLELFAEDVFQIIAPELNNEKIIVMGIKMNQRCTSVEGKIVAVNTLDALAIHALSGVVKADVIRQLMQWVRSNILPVFKRESPQSEYFYYSVQKIDFQQKTSLLSYLFLKGIPAEEKVIDFYMDILYKKIALSECNNRDYQAQATYFEIVQQIIRPFVIPVSSNYKDFYDRLVLRSANLLNAQELDLHVFNALKKQQDIEILNIMNQALIIQAVESTANKFIPDVKKFYLQILEHFSEEMNAGCQ